MKLIACAVFTFAIFGNLHAAPKVEGDLADRVQQVIDRLLAVTPSTVGINNEVIDIPANNLENGQITINEVSLSGLHAIDTKLNYDQASSRLDYVLNFEDIALVIDVAVHLEGLVTVDNHLSVHVNLKNLKNEGYAVVSTDSKEVTDFNIIVSLGKSDIVIKGLLNNDELSEKVSQLLTENVAEKINEINPVIAPFFSRIVKDIINIALHVEA